MPYLTSPIPYLPKKGVREVEVEQKKGVELERQK
jgi:hypothetical protein